MSRVNVTRITNHYNLSPQAVKQIANAVAQQLAGNANAALTGGQFIQAPRQLNTAAMAQPFPAQAPRANLQASQTFDLHALGKNAQKMAKAGYPMTGLSGALVEEGVGKTGWRFWNPNHKAESFEKKLKSDPQFRGKIEQRLGAKFVPDGSNDGKVTFAPLQAQLPGIRPNAAQVMNQYGSQTGGNCLAGIAQMQGNAMQLMLGMGGAAPQLGLLGAGAGAGALAAGGGLAIAGAGGGLISKAGLGVLSGLMGGGFGNPMGMSGAEWKLRSMFGMTKSQGGPGSRVAQLPAGASFEDIVAAFMVDVIDDMQKEAMAKMNQIRKSINSQNSLFGKIKGALGGLAGMAGGAAGFMVGGPLGAMAGGALGNAVGGMMGPGANADSRNLMFEELKNIMQKLQQMLQALSNVLNTMHQGAMNSIRNIRA